MSLLWENNNFKDPAMLLIISPAKTLDFETVSSTTDFTQPVLLSESQHLIDALKTLSADVENSIKISDS